MLQDNPEVTQEVIDEICGVLDNFTVFSILEGQINRFGGISATSREDLKGKVTLHFNDLKLNPMPDESISDESIFIFQMMKPAFAIMLGQMGQGMEFIVFQGRDETGERYFDPSQEGAFSVHMGERRFDFRLPLPSFLPPRFDPESGEQFSGTYRYNPFTGSELVSEEPSP